jgi:hypothetical protein
MPSGWRFFLIALRYTEIPDLAGRTCVVVEEFFFVFATNLMMYILFGPALIGLALAIRNEASLGNAAAGRAPVDLAAVIGAVLGGKPRRERHGGERRRSNPRWSSTPKTARRQKTYWRAIVTVHDRPRKRQRGNSREPLHLFRLARGASREFPLPAVAILGFAALRTGFLSVLRTLHDLSGLFGILQLIGSP